MYGCMNVCIVSVCLCVCVRIFQVTDWVDTDKDQLNKDVKDIPDVVNNTS
jgi:hypothetical protein